MPYRRSPSCGPLLTLRAVLCCVIAWLAFSGTAWAIRADLAIPQLRHAVWTHKDGAPPSVWAISQTTDGWMWFGGTDGLYRFDGVSFERVDTEPARSERSRAISALLASDAGELVVGYHDGGVAFLRGGHSVSYHQEAGLDSTTVFDLTFDADHRLWAGTRGGLKRFDGQRWQVVGPDQGLPASAVSSVLADADGRLWVATMRRLYFLERGKSTFRPGPVVQGSPLFIRAPDGTVWYAESGVAHVCPFQHPRRDGVVLPPTTVSNAALFDRQGSFWTFAPNGAARLPANRRKSEGSVDATTDASERVFPLDPGKGVMTLLEDRRGGIWMTTVDGEVHLFSEVAITTVGSPTWLVTGQIASSRDGSVWTAIRANRSARLPGDGLWRLDAGVRAIQASDLRSANLVFEPRLGDLVVAAQGWLWRRRSDRFVRDIPLPDGDDRTTGLADDAQTGQLWIVTLGKGLALWRHGAWQPNGGVSALPDEVPTALASDGAGTLWVGYGDGRLACVQGDDGARSVHWLDARVGAVRVVSIAGRVLAGGDRGISLIRGNEALALESEQTNFDHVTGVIQSPDGSVWVNDGAGIVQISADALRQTIASPGSTVLARVFDEDDGYPSSRGGGMPFGGSTARGRDGRIWFSSTRTASWIDPARVLSDKVDAPVILRSVTAGGKRMDATDTIRLAAGVHDLQVDYTALNYSHADRERFRYRLVGLGEAWNEAGSRRQAFFTNLGPGHYRFEVEAKSEVGVWQSAPTTLDVDVAPTFVQSPTFIALCAAASAIVLLLLARWWGRRAALDAQRKERERMTVRMSERERIAREIHDTLLQNAQATVLMIGAALSLEHRGRPVTEMLQRAAASSERSVVEARERIHELRHEGPITIDLRSELQTIGERLASAAGAARFALTGVPENMSFAAAQEVLRIGGEALVNAYRHANAQHVTLQFEQSDGAHVVRIQDDGKGIEEETRALGAAPGHWGLPGMRERANRLGGTLALKRRPGGGTCIELRVPADASRKA